MQRNVEFTIQENGNLKITLIPECREEVQEMSDKRSSAGHALNEVWEDQICNGWMDLEGMIALWGGPVISENATMEDNGGVTISGPVYAYTEYAIVDPVEQLLKYGEIIFQRFETEE